MRWSWLDPGAMDGAAPPPLIPPHKGEGDDEHRHRSLRFPPLDGKGLRWGVRPHAHSRLVERHHFTAPKVRPRTSCFWLNQPMSRMGAMASREAAESLARNRP